MKVLVACEESQAVTIELRKLGHEAYSCDLQDCSGGHPEWHIKGDVRNILYSCKWDLVIAFPTCTFLANSGSKHLYIDCKKENGFKKDRIDKMIEGAEFFKIFKFYGKLGNKIAIENPIMHKHAKNEIFLASENSKPTQIIQPYQFGHLEKKATCLWLYGLPKLKETNNVYNEMMKLSYAERAKVHYCPPGPNRQKIRSKTYPGIAKAMAGQWGGTAK